MSNKPAVQIESRPDFSSLLENEHPGEVKFTPPIPQGSYLAVVQPGWRRDTNQRGNKFHEHQFKLIEAFDDVDADELSTWIADNGNIIERTYKRQFFMTHEAVPYLDDFHQACGLDLQKLDREKVSRILRNDMVINSSVGVYIKHQPFRDNSGKVQPVIDRFFKVEG